MSQETFSRMPGRSTQIFMPSGMTALRYWIPV